MIKVDNVRILGIDLSRVQKIKKLKADQLRLEERKIHQETREVNGGSYILI